MFRRLGLSLVMGLMLASVLAASALGAANPARSSCFAQFVTSQEPGGVAESLLGNLAEAHPIGLNVISFTAPLKAPCFGEE